MRKISTKQWVTGIIDSCSFLTEEWEKTLMYNVMMNAAAWGKRVSRAENIQTDSDMTYNDVHMEERYIVCS